MSLWTIAWRSIQRRAVASTLTAFTMALGVLMVVAVLLALGIVSESFSNNSELGYHMVVGKKGGRLQLILNTVFYLSQPIENVPVLHRFPLAEDLAPDNPRSPSHPPQHDRADYVLPSQGPSPLENVCSLQQVYLDAISRSQIPDGTLCVLHVRERIFPYPSRTAAPPFARRNVELNHPRIDPIYSRPSA